MDSYGECTTAQQELDELELGRQPSHDLRFGQTLWSFGGVLIAMPG